MRRGTTEGEGKLKGQIRRRRHLAREPMGTAGLLIAVVALIFAVAGGAYAAKRYVITSKGQIKPSVREMLQGKRGKRGPVGPVGPAGTNGKDGARGPAGTNGSNGTNGVSPVGVAFEGNQNGCSEGGIELKGASTTILCNGKRGRNGVSIFSTQFSGPEGPCAEGGTKFEGGSGDTYACNGVPGTAGSPWTLGGTLPSGETETGVWTTMLGPLETFGNYSGQIAISYTLPLLTAQAAGNVQVNAPAYNGEDETGAEHEKCPGKVDNPRAKKGFLCVYTQQKSYKSVGVQSNRFKTGVVLTVFAKPKEGEVVVSQPGSTAFGTWAVTAP